MAERFLKGLVESVNKEEGTLSVAVATDASIDRDGEIVEVAGMDTSNFEKNPVLLYAHDYRSDPIGKVIALKRDGNRLLFTPQFAVKISERARQYFEMYKEGFLNAFSIGFIPKKYEDRDNGSGRINRVFTETELLEISAVPVPANPNALALVRSYKGMKIDEDIIAAMEKSAEELPPAEETPPAETPAAEGEEGAEAEKTTEEKVEEVAQGLADVKITLINIEKALSDNREKKEAPTVEELFRHPDFHRGVLRAVDKAIGTTLGRMKDRK